MNSTNVRLKLKKKRKQITNELYNKFIKLFKCKERN